MQREPEDQDAAWQAIVDNYDEPVLGDDPHLDPTPEPELLEPETPEAELPASELVKPVRREPEEPDELLADPEDTFVPPIPPPTPRPSPDRLLAWLGVLGSPAVLLVFVISGLDIPPLVGWVLVASFVAGFGYLVAQMPSDPRDPWDDGAQV